MSLSSLSLNPAYIAPSSWWQHVPIAHWLVAELKPARIVELGSHYGVSFFSFCEAAQAFSPDTFIYAIDTWEGDSHASYYDRDVFDQVARHWEHHHRLRSQLIRSTFDDALNYFENESIDILHIDGLHTYEAVLHDYQTWLPKLKPNSLILFHDINVRERNFGVWRLWQELKASHPTHEVANGHGLGLLVFGQDMWRNLNSFPSVIRALQSKGELLEKIACLTPGGSIGFSPLEQARAEAEQARIDAKQARADAERAQAQAEYAQAEVIQAQAEAIQAKAEAVQARQDLAAILKSKAWRLSRPARRCLDRLKSLLPAQSKCNP
ncbi:MAG: class I SAM-dependent methyltransferase [Synechococcus sp.]|nr:class I SAM-dependent methyltransferase [Synechococcus sp.]